MAAETGIDEAKVLKWTNMADLMRIKGVGEEYSELLEAAGVDTVKELRNRNAKNLAAAMAEANSGKKKLVRVLPGEKKVTGLGRAGQEAEADDDVLVTARAARPASRHDGRGAPSTPVFCSVQSTVAFCLVARIRYSSCCSATS